jgi:superfamily II DNA or RNA helicase/HKD family nuclease
VDLSTADGFGGRRRAWARLLPVAERELEPGLYEAILTGALEKRLATLVAAVVTPKLRDLADAEAADRLSRHLAAVVTRAIEALPEEGRAQAGAGIVEKLIELLSEQSGAVDRGVDIPLGPVRVLSAILRRKPDGSPDVLEVPLTPLLDTTLLTNSPGEPRVGHELRAEVHSADSIDVVMSFVRLSGINPMLDALRRHSGEGKKLRLVTTTYTNSTELGALDELARLGAEIKVSYDTATTRLHAKAWLFHRRSGYSTAYIGSSNLTHSAMVTGLEWNVRVSGARNRDVVAKMTAVFESYWASSDFVLFDRDEFRERTKVAEPGPALLPPTEIILLPFQERLLEQIDLARSLDRHRNLLVSATGTGKTVMAAVDYARLRERLSRDRLLFVAHRAEILEQSRATFAHALRDASFGEFWVAGKHPSKFEHVFASIQSLNASGLESIDPSYFDVVIVDEFHHAAAPSYRSLLERLKPTELVGMTATPERADGLDVLRYFDGRIAAELRVWDAIDQQYLVPFSYFGVHDGSDLTEVPWKRGAGYDPSALTNVLTADHVWARRVIEQLRLKTSDVQAIKALAFCVTIAHARFMAEQFRAVGIPSVAIWGDSPMDERIAALRDLDAGRVNVVFTVDLFNEGVDVPNVDTLLLLRPTESGTLFLQQLGRGLRRPRHGEKPLCTVLDFVGNHRREFRFDLRLRALLGGSRKDVEHAVQDDFPFLPAGCHMELDPVARDIVLRSIREAIPSDWKARREELRSLGDVTLAKYLEETGLELEDVYASDHTWSELRRAVGLATEPAGPKEAPLLRAVGRLLHVDDQERLDSYRLLVERESAPEAAALDDRERCSARMLIGSLTTLKTSATLEEGLAELWNHPQVRAELIELLDILPERVDHLHAPLGIPTVPLAVHARYTRTEILAAFGSGAGVKPITWQSGVWWDENSGSDLFAFTLDKSAGSFSPTTRYRDYAISPELIHWESQSATSLDSETGRRYVSQAENGTNVLLFARLRTADRAFWCLGPATYVSHEGERPIAITWRLHHRLPGDLYAEFAAAVA